VTPLQWVKWVLGGLAVLVAVMFTVQNSSRLTDLSLDLGFWAIHLERPLPLVYFLWGTLVVGFLAGFGLSALSRSADDRRRRDLEGQAERAKFGGSPRGGSDWAG
jgi:uncharacterized integral membrane protein